MNRFRYPTAQDEIAMCNGCDEQWHYTLLNDAGYCERCAERIAEHRKYHEHDHDDQTTKDRADSNH